MMGKLMRNDFLVIVGFRDRIPITARVSYMCNQEAKHCDYCDCNFQWFLIEKEKVIIGVRPRNSFRIALAYILSL